MNPKKFFYFTVILWLLIFSGFIVNKEYTLRTGTEVLLKTMPIDPTDLFRGDYVVLNYEISTLNPEELQAEHIDFDYNDRIYLALTLKEGYGTPKKIYTNPPENEIYIAGKVKDIFYDWNVDEAGNMIGDADIEELRVDYGIESYFVPEGKGLEIERDQGTGEKNVTVKVAIDKHGNALIKNLLINGEEIKY
ncbi:MAG: GDYXXLXY domain-containing protein [Methanosarcina sp.]